MDDTAKTSETASDLLKEFERYVPTELRLRVQGKLGSYEGQFAIPSGSEYGTLVDIVYGMLFLLVSYEQRIAELEAKLTPQAPDTPQS